MGVALSRRPRSSPVLKRLCCFNSLVVAIVVSARDALDIMGTFTKMSTITVTSTRDAFAIVAPLDDVVDLVT